MFPANVGMADDSGGNAATSVIASFYVTSRAGLNTTLLMEGDDTNDAMCLAESRSQASPVQLRPKI